MASEASAFCPGHLTAFFQMCPHEDPLRAGSRGAGLSLSRGVATRVRTQDASQRRITVRLNGREEPAPTTERAVDLFLEEDVDVLVDSDVQLPIGQGFGMSGAGALSTLLALNEALGRPRTRDAVVGLAHRAEVEARTGLGDVVPQSLGGLDIREKPGAPPHGLVHRVPLQAEVVLGVLGPPTYTKAVLDNPMVRESVDGVGGRMMRRFLPRRDLESFFRLSWLFARQTLLATTEIQAAVAHGGLYGQASMVFLGNSVFGIGETARLQEAWGAMGDVYVVNVDNEGARVV
ncbi:MAG: pantoate kinase [Thermoplasmata archaeon]|nr:pantoate kinase [Thermoplasmata archaeon]